MTASTTQLARRLAPEDIVRGQYIAVLLHTMEILPFDRLCPGDVLPSRVTFIPHAAEFYRVRDVCLPFVVVQTRKGKRRVLDTRLVQLASVGNRFGRRVFGVK